MGGMGFDGGGFQKNLCSYKVAVHTFFSLRVSSIIEELLNFDLLDLHALV